MIEEVLVFGAIQGAVYALLAIGFSLVYGVGGVLNLAHGAFYLIASYMAFWLYPYVGLPMGMIGALALVTLIGVLAYLLLIKPMQKSHIGVVIVTFALAFFLEQFVRVFELANKGLIVYQSLPGLVSGSAQFLGVTFSAQLVVAFLGSIILVTLVTLFIRRARIGKSIRAVSQDREAAMLMGINADRIVMLTVGLSAFLAGAAAILYIPAATLIPHMGWSVLLSAFAVVILGGMGSVPGSILGAFVLAYARNICNYFIDPAFSELVPLLIIVVVLIVRPRGLLGKKEVS